MSRRSSKSEGGQKKGSTPKSLKNEPGNLATYTPREVERVLRLHMGKVRKSSENRQRLQNERETANLAHPAMLDKETAYRAIQRLAELATQRQIHLSLRSTAAR